MMMTMMLWTDRTHPESVYCYSCDRCNISNRRCNTGSSPHFWNRLFLSWSYYRSGRQVILRSSLVVTIKACVDYKRFVGAVVASGRYTPTGRCIWRTCTIQTSVSIITWCISRSIRVRPTTSSAVPDLRPVRIVWNEIFIGVRTDVKITQLLKQWVYTSIRSLMISRFDVITPLPPPLSTAIRLSYKRWYTLGRPRLNWGSNA
jgi:hypothetical protein